MSEEDSEKIRTANGYKPQDRQILTEGYQPQGSNNIPTVVPQLVSGVSAPNVKTPSSPENQSTAPENSN